jgi:hypothetical protein
VHGSDSLRTLLLLAMAGAGAAAAGWLLPLAPGPRSVGILAGSGCAAACGLALWWRAIRLRATMAGTATARLGSAPQGYVELHGKGRRLGEEFSTVRPHYLWQRVTRSGGKHASVEVTEVPFGFSDGPATAVILPQGAEVVCANRQVTRNGREKTVIESIHSGEPLYVLGYLASLDRVADLAAEAERIAADIRLDRRQRRRFDLDGDGHLDVAELLKLHETAQKMAREAAATQTETHVIARPPDGRRYLISTLPPAVMARRLLGLACLGLATGATGAASLAAWAARTNF